MYLRLILLITGPIVFALSLFLFQENSSIQIIQVLALAFWMVTWWISEIVAIPVTALLPLVILPVIGVFSISESCAPYANPIIFLFMGGFMIALALEKHKLHLRIALNILKLTGTSGNGVILGFMISTALLSMWISNTATAVMMLPVALSVIDLLTFNKLDNAKNKKFFALALMLSIAYSANIGGTITLIGTPPNVVMAGYLREILGYEISFAMWLLMGICISVPILIMTYFILIKFLFPNNLKRIEGSDELISMKLKELGSLKKEEKRVIGIFLLTAFCWIFKSQINGLIGENLLNDSSTAMIGGMLMFIMPVNLKEKKFLLIWEDTLKLPWGILILFGGGMCLAKALEQVGLIEEVGIIISALNTPNTLLLVMIVTILVLFLTEIMSNVALVTIFIPVAIGIANGLSLDPLLIVIPATLASSCAFMMPISTPPNAVVFSSGHIKMDQMIKAGWILNIVSALVIGFLGRYLIPLMF